MHVHVTPAPGLLIPDPSQQWTPDYYLPPEGRVVEFDDFWARRVRDGDVTVATDTPTT
jgi:hypothetical protein